MQEVSVTKTRLSCMLERPHINNVPLTELFSLPCPLWKVSIRFALGHITTPAALSSSPAGELLISQRLIGLSVQWDRANCSLDE